MKRILILAVISIAAAIFWFASRPPETGNVASGRPLVTVEVPELSAGEKAGEALFAANCAACHGVNAAGNDGAGPPLVHKIYEPNHHGDAAFQLAAQRGVRAHHWEFGDMAPVPGITEDEISKIVAYVRTLQRANGIR
jgi:mono/diheme cytochrome c family protein